MDLDLRAYARMLLKRKWFVAAGLLVSLALGMLLTARTAQTYRTRTTLFVGERQVALEEVSGALYLRNLAGGLLKSYVEIIKSRSIAQLAIVDGGLDASPAEIQGGLHAGAVLDTQVIEITYQGTDPARVQRIANAVADAFVKDVGRLGGEDLERPAVQVSIIDRAVAPGSPVGPNATRNIVLSLALGLFFGVGLAIVVEHIDVSVKHRDEIEELGLHVLGSIPRMEAKDDQLHLERDMQGMAAESFRKLRTSIGFINLETPTRSILVTSPVSQEGKTTTALNLASAYALGGLRTILVEADLRRPSLHKVFGMIGTRGLTTAIVGDVPLTEAIMHTETRNLSVLLAGAIPPNPVELLGSDQMTELLERLERMFDVVIIDAPPLVPVADPAALAGRCDGVLLIARAGKTDRRRLLDAATMVQRAGGTLIGVVLNFLKPGETPYEYEYYYGYRKNEAPTMAGTDKT